MFVVVQLFLQILIAILLLWFGYNLFFSFSRQTKSRPSTKGKAGDPRTCPVCGTRLMNGERVKSSVFPTMGNTDRLMHIFGCPYCLKGSVQRYCPVCHTSLSQKDYLIARMFERPHRSHVHVLGCTQCRRG
ncbi:MAG: hypothetical protein N2Z76_05990 [Treponemataceae bacterium]|nr:hypothetical protein [Treponemataceae bacterium]